VSRILSVRKTPAIDDALSEILHMTDAATASEAVARALDLYRWWLRLKPGTTAVVTGHTRRMTRQTAPH
jgi:outer membrane protein OmpA-like peptidoglycan-associated protein